MITEIEYMASDDGPRLLADKNVAEKNAWHLASLAGNGADFSILGSTGYGIAGQSYAGINVEAREVSAVLYADGYSPQACQQMLNDANIVRAGAIGADSLGVLRLMNALGERYRIPARMTAITPSQYRRRSVKVSMDFTCPYYYFEQDTLQIVPIVAVDGGKEYPLNRPYYFGNQTTTGNTFTVVCVNSGDVAAPVTLKLYGVGLTAVHATNNTTGASLEIGGNGMSVDGLELCTDSNNLYARFPDGRDASRYVGLASSMSDFMLAPGANEITVQMTASSITVAGTCIEYRGRYSTCL